MASGRVVIMGAVSGVAPARAWRAYHLMVTVDRAQRAAMLRLAESVDGRAMLNASRDIWHARGFDEAPFEIVFREAVRAQELR